MRLGSMVSACAVSAMAMVFSVQQGEHGPLVVYKLEVPRSAAPAARPSVAVPPQPAPGRAATPRAGPAPSLESALQVSMPAAAPARKLSPLKPTILGTVVMPAKRRPLPAAEPLPLAPLPAAETPGSVALDPFAFVHQFHDDQEAEVEVMINEGTGERLTLDQVTDALTWRRDTAEKLRQLPVGPRF